MTIRAVFFFVLMFASLLQSARAEVYLIGGIVGVDYDYDVSSGTSDGPSDADFLELSGTTGFRLGMGMPLNDLILLEAYYVDYGTADSGFTSQSNTGRSEDFSFELHPTAVVLQALASHSVSESYSVFGKLGVSSWQFDTDTSYVVKQGTSELTNIQLSGDDDGVDLLYGIGLEKRLASGASLRFDIEKLTLDSEVEVDLTQFGFSYRSAF